MESWASVLSSPTIRLSIPTSTAQFFVHRSLLQQQTNLLSNLKPRDTHISLPSPATEATLRIFLEYLYSSSYSLPTPAPKPAGKKREIAPEEDDTPHYITTTFNASPLLTAASLGAIGVWGKAPAKHAKYTSIHTGDGVLNNRGTHLPKDSIYVKPDGTTSLVSDSSILTPPPSPKLKKVERVVEDLPPRPQVKKPVLIADHTLNAHLEVYRFAKHFQITGLAHLALKNFSEALLSKEQVIKTTDVAKLIETIFSKSNRHDDKELKAFLVRYAALRLDVLKEDEKFAEFAAKGGEFVLGLLGVVAGKKGVEPWIL